MIGCFGFMALLYSILFYIGSSTRKMEKEKRNDRREKKYLKRKKQASSASTDDSCPTIIQTSCFPFLILVLYAFDPLNGRIQYFIKAGHFCCITSGKGSFLYGSPQNN